MHADMMITLLLVSVIVHTINKETMTGVSQSHVCLVLAFSELLEGRKPHIISLK